MMGIVRETSTGPGNPSLVFDKHLRGLKKSMVEEFGCLWEKESFKEGMPPPWAKPTKTCFAFKIKCATDGSIERHESRLEVRCFPYHSRVASSRQSFQSLCLTPYAPF